MACLILAVGKKAHLTQPLDVLLLFCCYFFSANVMTSELGLTYLICLFWIYFLTFDALYVKLSVRRYLLTRSVRMCIYTRQALQTAD